MKYETLAQVRTALLHRAEMMPNHEDTELLLLAAALVTEFEAMPAKLADLAAELKRLEMELARQ